MNEFLLFVRFLTILFSISALGLIVPVLVSPTNVPMFEIVTSSHLLNRSVYNMESFIDQRVVAQKGLSTRFGPLGSCSVNTSTPVPGTCKSSIRKDEYDFSLFTHPITNYIVPAPYYADIFLIIGTVLLVMFSVSCAIMLYLHIREREHEVLLSAEIQGLHFFGGLSAGLLCFGSTLGIWVWFEMTRGVINQEFIAAQLNLHSQRRLGSRMIITGCILCLLCTLCTLITFLSTILETESPSPPLVPEKPLPPRPLPPASHLEFEGRKVSAVRLGSDDPVFFIDDGDQQVGPHESQSNHQSCPDHGF